MSDTTRSGLSDTTRIAVVQLAAIVGDTNANMRACEALADRAAGEGAQWIILPEFFTTGMAYDRRLVDAAMPPDGAATELLITLARRHAATVGGSFLCRDADGHVRNAFFLVSPEGSVLGRHDKDLPTMWENCFYTGGGDDGVIGAGNGLQAGVAMCWELIRSQTARRLRDRVDVVVGGSCWWSVPRLPPRAITRRMEAANRSNAIGAAANFARLVGAPVAHAAHCGGIGCPMPWLPLRYHGNTEGGAAVFDADGRTLAFRDASEGPGIAIADVQLGRRAPAQVVPDDFWLCDRGAIAAGAW
ncbi:MAG: carbon-nitrogen hydrolase family protein, partial [Thermoleophilia bacterium]|nr:carbon-nitrogen hydrolase family protein [Thermoleophilia bacterium]